DASHCVGDVVSQTLLLVIIHDLAVQDARLDEVIIILVLDVRCTNQVSAVWIWVDVKIRCLAIRLRRGLTIIQEASALGVTVRGVTRVILVVEQEGHGALVLIGVDLVSVQRLVHWQLLVVRTDAVALLVSVCESTCLQHAVWGQANAWNQVGWIQCNLLNLCKEVAWVAVQNEVANVVQWVIFLGPCLGQIEWVPAVVFCILERHDLDLNVPDWVVALLNRVVQIFAVVVGILTSHLRCLSIGEGLPTLTGLEVVLDPDWLALFVDPLEGVGAEAVLVTGGLRGTAVAHQVGHLVCRLWGTSPEIPLHIGVAQAVAAKTLLRVDEVWELNAITQEEGWGVVTHDVVVAVFGVKAQCETVNVTPGIWGALLTSNRGETNHHWGDGVLLEQLCLGEFGNVFR